MLIIGTEEEFSKSERGLKRISKFHPGWLILLATGLVGMVFAVYAQCNMAFQSREHRIEKLQDKIQRLEEQSGSILIPSSLFISTAYAEGRDDPAITGDLSLPRDTRDMLVFGVFFVLALLLLGSCAALLFSTNAEKVRIANNLTQTLIGFFTGVGTSLLGIG